MLSILRIILIPVFILLFFSNGTKSVLIAAIVLIVSGLTDILDGIIARKFNMTTALGRILDPLADKLTQASVCICLVVKKVAPVWLLLLLILKEVLMIAGGAK
ncbi:MAG TPA: CDP-alcohol phosphatidyltransferase family protein, partial [Clostridia bacterium]|nr:CDP-alcohol phosphatidyltransferase family protein [Clostridia bacterium]